MRKEITDDNIYQEGTIVSAKVDPTLKLIIKKYCQRIYYCSVVDHPEQNKFAYFERELIPPNTESKEVHFFPVNRVDGNYVFKEQNNKK
jgi:hypothetical protein